MRLVAFLLIMVGGVALSVLPCAVPRPRRQRYDNPSLLSGNLAWHLA